MRRNLYISIIAAESAIIWWVLFGGGELNSPNLGIRFLVYIAEGMNAA